MKTQAERNAELDGYQFTGIYTEDKGEAKRRAKEERAKGNKARVLSKIYKGRVYNTIGYSVYIKSINLKQHNK